MKPFSKVFHYLLIVSICFVLSMTAVAKQSPSVGSRINGKVQTKATYFALPNESHEVLNSSFVSIGKEGSARSSASVSPGTIIGDTWFDYQQNGTMGRMIDWGNDVTTGAAYIHTSWMKLPAAAITLRHFAYRHYNANTGAFGSIVNLLGPTDYGGYVNLQAKSDGAAVVGGHNNPGNVTPTNYQSHFYYNFAPGNLFWFESRVDDSVATYGSAASFQEVIWPKFAYQEGTDTVTHVMAQVFSTELSAGVYYFRKVGVNNNGTWDYPPYVVDTQNVLGHSLTASKTSDRVAMAWLARVPDEGDCDTCSSNGDITLLWEQSENDIYYQISDDQGVNWNPRVNVTKYQWGAPSFRAYSELSILFDNADNFHVVWPGRQWADSFENLILPKACRVFHWSENVPVIRVAVNNDWEQDDSIKCSGGIFELNASKVQVSECDGKIYILYVQYNDFPNGVYDDCASRYTSEYANSANGDLYFVVSTDGGTTWDIPRNITNSRTPGCEPGVSGDCESDAWPSMTRYGRQDIPSDDWSGATIVDPSGSYAGDMYLDVQYLSDRDPGGYADGTGSQGEGTQQLSNMQWFRLACVGPIPAPNPIYIPDVDLPTWVKPGEFLDMPLTIVNNGNVALNYTPTVVEDNGPAGWLNVSGLSGSVPSGLSNVEVGTLHLNDGGVQTTPDLLVGRIIFTSNAPNDVTINVKLYVVDTLYPTTVDTLEGYLSLTVFSDGSYGSNRYSMDYVNNGVDCDTLAGTYISDGSPVILTANGGDTTLSSSIFSSSWLTEDGFKPIGGATLPSSGSGSNFNWSSTGTFTTADSTVAYEQTFYAPTDVGANYMIKALKVWSLDGAAHSGIRIGDAIDWDVPSDSGSDNISFIDGVVARNLIYQVGTEWDTDDTLYNTDCMDGDRRFAGMAFLKSVRNGVDENTSPFSAYTARNDSEVYPTGDFVAGDLWNRMNNSGFTVETGETDQHMVMCYDPSLSLAANDTVIFYTTLITVYDGVDSDVGDAADSAKAFAEGYNYNFASSGSCAGQLPGDANSDGFLGVDDIVFLVNFIYSGGPAPSPLANGDPNGDCRINIGDLIIMGIGQGLVDCTCETPDTGESACCFDIRGNVDYDPQDIVDISDLVYLVDFMFTNGQTPMCPDEANVDGDIAGLIDISDLVYLVDFMFTSGPEPPSCF